jgi:hypothetical protein
VAVRLARIWVIVQRKYDIDSRADQARARSTTPAEEIECLYSGDWALVIHVLTSKMVS